MRVESLIGVIFIWVLYLAYSVQGLPDSSYLDRVVFNTDICLLFCLLYIVFSEVFFRRYDHAMALIKPGKEDSNDCDF